MVTTLEARRTGRRRAALGVVVVALVSACLAGPGTSGTPSPGAQASGAGPVSHEYLPDSLPIPTFPRTAITPHSS